MSSSFHCIENLNTPSTLPPAFLTLSFIESATSPLYDQVKLLFHFNIFFELLFTGAIKLIKLPLWLFSNITSILFEFGNIFVKKSWIETSSTLSKFFILSETSFFISSKMSKLLFTVSIVLFANRILFIVISSITAYLLLREFSYPKFIISF